VPDLGVACYAAACGDFSKPHDEPTILDERLGRKAAFGQATVLFD